MFVFKWLGRTTLRSMAKAVIVVAVSLLLVTFIGIYQQTINGHKQMLADLYKDITVTGNIIRADGRPADDLYIRPSIIEELEQSGFIDQARYTRNLVILGDADSEQRQHAATGKRRLVGANSLAALTALNRTEVEYWQHYDDSLFVGTEMVCVVSDKLLSGWGLKLGDTIHLTIAENQAPGSQRALAVDETTFQIVATYTSQGQDEVYIPWGTINTLYEQLGIRMTTASADFTLQNTGQLDEFRDILSFLNFFDPYEAGRHPAEGQLGFILNDATLVNATNSVENHISYLTILYPALYVICMVIGFVISYLIIRLRKPEFAVMRALGTSGGKTFTLFFSQQMVLCLLGVALGTILLTTIMEVFPWLPAAGYVLCYLVGTAGAIMTLNRGDVIKILTAKE